MERDGRKVEAQNAHVLYDQGIGPGPVQFMDEAFGLGQFVVVENGIECDIDTCAERVGVVGQAGNVVG